MTRDEIISMARDADPLGEAGRLFAMAELTPETLERFAALVAAAERTAMARHFDVSLRNAVTAEREACALLAEKHEEGPGGAEAIRARGSK